MLRAWGPTNASTVTYVTPVVGVVLGVLLLGETFSWHEPVGAVLVLLGILLAQKRLRLLAPRRSRPPHPPLGRPGTLHSSRPGGVRETRPAPPRGSGIRPDLTVWSRTGGRMTQKPETSTRSPWRRLRGRVSRKTFGRDAVAGLVLGVESVPDGLAAGLLAGLNPVSGLYAYLFGMVGAAFFTSSSFMAVQATGAMSLVVADADDPRSRPDPAGALVTLGLLTGVIMVVAGLLKGGQLLRFVPTAVMTGFISAVGVNIVLGQLGNLTGYSGQGAGRLQRTFDLLLHVVDISWPTLTRRGSSPSAGSSCCSARP